MMALFPGAVNRSKALADRWCARPASQAGADFGTAGNERALAHSRKVFSNLPLHSADVI